MRTGTWRNGVTISLTMAVFALWVGMARRVEAALQPWDIALILMNCSNPDSFAFVALAGLAEGEVLHFTDNGWQNSPTAQWYGSTEGTVSYTVPAGGVPRGTTVRWTGETNGPWEVTGSFALNAGGDQIIAYQGDSAAPTFLYALNDNGNGWQTAPNGASDTDLPPGLVSGVTALAFTPERDNIRYRTTGAVYEASGTELLVAIGAYSNWEGQDTTPWAEPAGPFVVQDEDGQAAHLTITSPVGSFATYAFAASNITLSGACSTAVVGMLAWTNALIGAGGEVPASTNWSIPDVPMAVGTNDLSVFGTNAAGEAASDGFRAIRLPTGAARGDVVVSEIMQNPYALSDTEGEWFEVYNRGTGDVDMAGWTITDGAGESRQISAASLVLRAGGFLVLGLAWRGDRGGAPLNYTYTGIVLGNAADRILLLDPLGAEVARAEYDGGIAWPNPNGASMMLRRPDADCNDPAEWTVSTSLWINSSGDLGSPGQPNDGWANAPSNRPPWLRLSPAATNMQVRRGASVAVNVVAREADGDALHLEAEVLPYVSVFAATDGVSVLTNTWRWTPQSNGTADVSFRAADKDGAARATIHLEIVDPLPPAVWINEIHYDNTGADANEGVEIAGPAGFSLEGYGLVFYNGGDSTSYGQFALSGVIDHESYGFGALWFPYAGIQNGAPDGVALVDAHTNVLQFLSYEGTFRAANGPAAGLLSTDLGVAEPDSEPTGLSLQLQGTGHSYAEFHWSGPTNQSRGFLNAGQAIPPPTGAVLVIR
jgi:hypothetical protein